MPDERAEAVKVLEILKNLADGAIGSGLLKKMDLRRRQA
jgi:hypothetical protein